MSLWITDFTQKIENWASETDFVFNFAAGYYKNIIEKEVILANITQHDHILCIGGGICPFSAILFHQATGAKVTVIDNNAHCTSKAKQVIKKLGLSNYVKVLCQDGNHAELSLAQYTVIHFALQVCPMEGVFSNIETKAAPGTKLLVRRPKKQIRKWYSQLPNALLDCCPLTTHKKARNIGSTLLYIKCA